jgi:hypothetical protein
MFDRRSIVAVRGPLNSRDLMTIEDWLKAACEDAERRGLAALKPLLESLARSTAALRDADRIIDRTRLEP